MLRVFKRLGVGDAARVEDGCYFVGVGAPRGAARACSADALRQRTRGPRVPAEALDAGPRAAAPQQGRRARLLRRFGRFEFWRCHGAAAELGPCRVFLGARFDPPLRLRRLRVRGRPRHVFVARRAQSLGARDQRQHEDDGGGGSRSPRTRSRCSGFVRSGVWCSGCGVGVRVAGAFVGARSARRSRRSLFGSRVGLRPRRAVLAPSGGGRGVLLAAPRAAASRPRG